LWSLLAILGVGLLAPGAARAAFMSINDVSSPPGTITFSLNDFEFGFNVNGTLVQSGLGHPATITVPESPMVTFSGSWIDNGLTSTGTHTIFWVAPNAPNVVTDELTFSASSAGGHGTISGTWLTDLGIPLPVGAIGIPEDGRTMDFSQPFLTAQAIAGDPVVPEPTSLAVFGLAGLAVAGWSRWWIRKPVTV
jgi:hypothetical protein